MDWLALGGLFSPDILTGEGGEGERAGALGSLDLPNLLVGAGVRVGALGGLL